MTDFWNGCKRAVYLVLFAILIPVSAYVFYGAVDTLNNAAVLQGILHGKMVPAFLLGTSFLFCVLYLELFRIAEPWIEKHWRRAVPLLVIAMFAVQVLFVLTVRSSLRQDHLKIFDAAVALVEQGGTIGQTHFKSYFMKYPNNIPMYLPADHPISLQAPGYLLSAADYGESSVVSAGTDVLYLHDLPCIFHGSSLAV